MFKGVSDFLKSAQALSLASLRRSAGETSPAVSSGSVSRAVSGVVLFGVISAEVEGAELRGGLAKGVGATCGVDGSPICITSKF